MEVEKLENEAPENIIDTSSTKTDIKQENVEEDDQSDVDYREKYKNIKRKLKSLLYEQECFHEELRKIQRKSLRVSRDKSFLLDRLLQYEQPDLSTDDDLTDSSSGEEEEEERKESSKSKVSDSKRSKPPAKNNSQSAERSRCKHIEKGKQCTKMVSKKIKSGICQTHRQALAKQAKEALENKEKEKTQSKPASPITTPSRKPPTGGKDIGQIREAMEASSKLAQSSSENEDNDDDDLIIDVPH